MPDAWDPDEVITLTEAPTEEHRRRPALHWIALAEVCINSARDRLPRPEGQAIIARLDEALEALNQLRSQLP